MLRLSLTNAEVVEYFRILIAVLVNIATANILSPFFLEGSNERLTIIVLNALAAISFISGAAIMARYVARNG